MEEARGGMGWKSRKGKGGGGRRGMEGEGKGDGMWRGQESGLPWGSRWLSAGLTVSDGLCCHAVQMLHGSLAAEAGNEYRNITVMTSLLPQPTTVQYIGCCGQYKLLTTSHGDATVADIRNVNADMQYHRQAFFSVFHSWHQCYVSSQLSSASCKNCRLLLIFFNRLIYCTLSAFGGTHKKQLLWQESLCVGL